MDREISNSLLLGNGPQEYNHRLWRPADAIHVDKLRLILTWPLVLRAFPAENAGSIKDTKKRQEAHLRQVKCELNNHKEWRIQEDLAKYTDAPHNIYDPSMMHPGFEGLGDKANRYGEFVYFHDFVQEALYHKNKKDYPNSPVDLVMLFQRNDIKSISARFTTYSKDFSVVAGVENINLHLFGTGAAMVSIELEFGLKPEVQLATGPHPMMLSYAQTIIDQIRRTYSPYFNVSMNKKNFDKKEINPSIFKGRIPLEFQWLDENGLEVEGLKSKKQPYSVGPNPTSKEMNAFLDDAIEDIHTEQAGYRRCLPLLDHWRALVAPLRIDGDDAVKGDGPIFRQVTDERIPLMSFISIGEVEGHNRYGAQRLQSISRGDWMRLCFADEPGTNPLPYSAAFLKDFETIHCYDRFAPSQYSYGASRIMFSGNNMCMVTEGEFGNTILVHHFRRHYYQMALIINMEFAALLATSSYVSAAVRQFKTGLQQYNMGYIDERRREKQLEKNLRFAERSFLEFTHLYHFGGLSSQMQATEMFNMWRQHAKIDTIYQEVKEEVQAGSEFLRNEELADQAQAAHDLNKIVAILGGFGLLFSFFGMNVFFGDADQLHRFSDGTHWSIFTGVLALVISATLVIALVFGAINHFRNAKTIIYLLIACFISILAYNKADQIADLFRVIEVNK